MGKIKSAKEIAIEKTAYMVSDPDFKKRTMDEYNEYKKAANTLASSILENKSEPEKLKEAIRHYPEEAKIVAAKIFMQKFAEGINFKNTPQVIQAMRYLTEERVILDACDEVLKLHSSFTNKIEENKENEENNKSGNNDRLLKQLASEGITGSAIYSINITEINTSDNNSGIEEDYNTQLSGFRSFLECRA